MRDDLLRMKTGDVPRKPPPRRPQTARRRNTTRKTAGKKLLSRGHTTLSSINTQASAEIEDKNTTNRLWWSSGVRGHPSGVVRCAPLSKNGINPAGPSSSKKAHASRREYIFGGGGGCRTATLIYYYVLLKYHLVGRAAPYIITQT